MNKYRRCNFYQRDNITRIGLCAAQNNKTILLIVRNIRNAPLIKHLIGYLAMFNSLLILYVYFVIFQAGPRAEAENRRKIFTNREVCDQKSPSLPCGKSHSSSCSSTGQYWMSPPTPLVSGCINSCCILNCYP